MVKTAVFGHKTNGFAPQNVPFQHVKGMLLQYKSIPFASALHNK